MSGPAPPPHAHGGSRRVMWAAIPVVVFAALAMAMLFALRSGDPSVLPSALVGKPVPEFALAPLEGLERGGTQVPGLDAAALREGEVTIVNVWASWCGPCRTEHPILMGLHDDGLRVVGINYKDEPENGRRFLGTLGNPYDAVGVDDDGRSAIDWGVYGVPETFVVDGKGIIRHKYVGPLSPEAVETILLPAVEAAKTPG